MKSLSVCSWKGSGFWRLQSMSELSKDFLLSIKSICSSVGFTNQSRGTLLLSLNLCTLVTTCLHWTTTKTQWFASTAKARSYTLKTNPEQTRFLTSTFTLCQEKMTFNQVKNVSWYCTGSLQSHRSKLIRNVSTVTWSLILDLVSRTKSRSLKWASLLRMCCLRNSFYTFLSQKKIKASK